MTFYKVNLQQKTADGALLSVSEHSYNRTPWAAIKEVAARHRFDLTKLMHMSVDEG